MSTEEKIGHWTADEWRGFSPEQMEAESAVLSEEEYARLSEVMAEPPGETYDPLGSEPPKLSTAASLLPPDYDGDDGDFEPGGKYKGFLIVDAPAEPPAAHSHLEARFYVVSPKGTVGLVPWSGSHVVWPWEAGWVQDLHRSEVQSFLKPDEEKKGRKK